MIAALLSEGVAVLRDARGATERRILSGLERDTFVKTMLFGALVTVSSVIVPELTGVSAAADRAMGDEPSDLMLSWPMFPAMIAAILGVTAAIIWRGPQFTNRLAQLFGGNSTLMGGAFWLHLATLGGVVISLAVMASDVVLGLALPMLPVSAGWVSLGVSLLSLIVSVAVSTQVAQHLFQISNQTRGLVFVIVWFALSLLLLSGIWFVVYGFLGGPVS